MIRQPLSKVYEREFLSFTERTRSDLNSVGNFATINSSWKNDQQDLPVGIGNENQDLERAHRDPHPTSFNPG
jgi:hypothetical protein